MNMAMLASKLQGKGPCIEKPQAGLSAAGQENSIQGSWAPRRHGDRASGRRGDGAAGIAGHQDSRAPGRLGSRASGQQTADRVWERDATALGREGKSDRAFPAQGCLRRAQGAKKLTQGNSGRRKWDSRAPGDRMKANLCFMPRLFLLRFALFDYFQSKHRLPTRLRLRAK